MTVYVIRVINLYINMHHINSAGYGYIVHLSKVCTLYKLYVQYTLYIQREEEGGLKERGKWWRERER